MLKLGVLMLLGLSASFSAHAGLFADEGARKRIEHIESRASSLEGAVKQQTKSMLDLQGEIDALNEEVRKLRGQNEELIHGLQDAEKRQKDFYLDLDTRLRQLEAAEAAAKEAAASAPVAPKAKKR